MARILFVLVLLLALPANALTWFDCGFAWSAELIQAGPPGACIGPLQPDGSCRSYDVIWEDRIGGGNPIVVHQRFCSHQGCSHIPCGARDLIMPDNAANVSISGQTGSWFCTMDPPTVSTDTPRIMVRCHN